MQLWLLGHCITHCQSQDPPLRLQSYVREQCQLHLVNTSAGPIAELSCWRLLCQNSKNDAPRPPVTTITDDCMQINHADLEVRLSPWRQSLQQFLSDACEILNDELLLGLAGLKAFSVTSLKDNMAELRPGLSFLDDPRNGLHAVRSNVVHQVCHDGPLRARFFLRPGSTTDAESANGVLCNRPELDDYLHANQRFLQLLAILIIMTAGLPPRRKELLGISWCNQEVPRNIFIHDGLLAVITAYHKSQWRVGNRPIARFLPPGLGDLLVRYLIYVPPLLRFFYRCMQSPTPRGFLFASMEHVWHPDRLSVVIK